MIKKLIYLSILLLFILNLFGCDMESNIDKQNTIFKNTIESTSDRDKLPMATTGGINIGLYNIDGNIEKDFNFYINENESFEKFISIGHLIDKPRTYKLLIFVDFKQTLFNIDDQEPTLDYTFDMNPYETIEIPIMLQQLQKGQHEILFVIVKDPNNKSLDEEFRKSTDMNHLLFIRCNVIVEKENIPNYEHTKINDVNNKGILDGVFINNDKKVLKRWLSSTISVNETLSYYIHVGNNTFDEKEYALIILQGWQQVDVEGSNVLYLKLNKNEMATFEATINKISTEGIYDLTPILIHNPYSTLNINNKDVETAIRVGIKVKK